MWTSFIKKFSKCEKNIVSLEEIANYMKYINREIQIDNITPQMAEKIDCLIRFWNIVDEENKKTFSEREPIKFYINSLGGDLNSALTIMNSISMSRTPVYTFNIGTVQKESFLIYIVGHKRFTYSDADFLYSNNSFLFLEEEGNTSSFYNKNDLINSKYKSIKRLFLDIVKIKETQYDKYCKNDWYFSAEDAFELHIANEISRKHYHCTSKENGGK